MYSENSKRMHAVVYSILGVLLVAVSAFAIYQYQEHKQLRRELNNQYSRAFYEITDYIEEIETGLRKGMLTSSPAQLASISGEIYRLSNSAKACLGELPTSDIQLDNTAKFLSQVGDYTYVLSQNAINGEKISEQQYKDLESLTDYASKLNSALAKMQNGIENGSISLAVNRNGMTVVHAAGDILSDLENVEKSFSEYPSLIYDGPFSEHIENRQSPMLTTAREITLDDAKKTAAEFLKTSPDNIIFESDTQNSAIDSYNFYADLDTRVNVSISKKGGYVVYFLKNREVNNENVTFKEAIEKGGAFLQEHGFYSMANSYYDKAYGVATVNYAYMQGDVKCYSDLIKVKIALDNGEILGMEAGGYLMNHTKRSLASPVISEESARAKLNPHLKFKSVQTALIPKDSLEEVLCYEFHGTFAGKNFIVYVNCENGHEEKILMLIESENGILTV